MAGKNCSKKSAIAVGILCGVLLLTTIALIAIYGSFDKLVARMIYGNVAITPSSSVYSQWVSPDTPILFSIYLFNITNEKEIEKGGKPRVQQLGPYVYREKRTKTNITWPKGDTSRVSFYQRLVFTLDRNLSIGDPDKDTVIGISTPFVAIAANMEAGNGPSSEEYTFMTLLIKPKLFIKTSVTKFLWGYVDSITYVCNAFDSKKCPTPKVGLMLGKNETDVGPFVIDTGVNDVTKLGNILTFQGKDTVDVWSSDKANQIIGTDGSHVAPDLTMDSRRFIFVADLCRSFEMRADGIGKLTNSDKIKVFSLSGTPETAQSAAMNPDNLGYCPPKTPGPKCPPAGTFDLSSCRRQGNLRPPVYSSQPYFLGADPALREGIDGLYMPSKDNASTKVFVEPKLGLVLEAYKRLQISIYVRPSKAMAEQFKNWTKPVFLPMVWFEEKAVAGADTLQVLYEAVYVKPEKGRFLLLIVIGVVLGLLAIFMFTLVAILLNIRRKERRVVSAKNAHANSSHGTKYTKVAIADANDRTVGI